MDSGFFADPDPGLDPSIWRSLTKKDSVDMKYNIFFYFYPSFRTFFSRILIRIFCRSGSGLRKKSLIWIRKKNLDPKHWKNVKNLAKKGFKNINYENIVFC